MLEIERKFLIKEIPNDLKNCEKQEILQWYFKQNNKNIRIRKTTSYKKWRKYTTYTMTKKQWSGLVRQENERNLSEKQFWDYREFAKSYQIKKTRYLYPYKKHIIEINQFHDNLDGLRMTEVEFWSEKESQKFISPIRFDIEVTEKKEANNSYMAVHGLNKLIRKTNYQDIITRFQLKNFYNQESKKYSQTRKKHRTDANIILETIQKYPSKEINIVELGCWSGRFLKHLELITNKKINYIWVDLSENLLEEAKKISNKKNIKTDFVCKDMVSYLSKCQQENVDIIIGIASFQHLTNRKERFLASKYMYRCLKYEGFVIMTNRSFSIRMLKKYRKTIIDSFQRKMFHRSKNERNNLMIPWKSENIIHKRFYHIFTKKELKNLFSQSWFVLENLSYLTKEWIPTNNWKESNNTLITAKKTIFIP